MSGPPSPGCQTCKQRRIKCDGAKPRCQRCVKSRRICLDTAIVKRVSTTFLAENAYASGQSKRPRGPRANLTLLAPHIDLQERSLAYYLQHNCQVKTDGPSVFGGVTEVVHAWTTSGDTNAMVDLALSSLALAIFSRTQNYPPAAIKAASKYHRLLRLAQDEIVGQRAVSLSSSSLANGRHSPSIDHCLLTISLMAQYEGATHYSRNIRPQGLFSALQSWAHHDGALALLKFWVNTPDRGPASDVLRKSRRGLVKSCLLRNRKVPGWMSNGAVFGETGMELDYDRVYVRMVNLHYNCTQIDQQGRKRSASACAELFAEAQDIDTCLHDWSNAFPESWKCEERSLSLPGPWPRKGLFSPTVFIYRHIGYAGAWCQYLAARMLVISIQLRLLRHGLSDDSVNASSTVKQEQDCIVTLKATGEKLASNIPFCLRKVVVSASESSSSTPNVTLRLNDDTHQCLAHWVAWPITLASSLEEVDPIQRRWFRSELARLGKVLGDGVLASADSDMWTSI